MSKYTIPLRQHLNLNSLQYVYNLHNIENLFFYYRYIVSPLLSMFSTTHKTITRAQCQQHQTNCHAMCSNNLHVPFCLRLPHLGIERKWCRKKTSIIYPFITLAHPPTHPFIPLSYQFIHPSIQIVLLPCRNGPGMSKDFLPSESHIGDFDSEWVCRWQYRCSRYSPDRCLVSMMYCSVIGRLVQRH